MGNSLFKAFFCSRGGTSGTRNSFNPTNGSEIRVENGSISSGAGAGPHAPDVALPEKDYGANNFSEQHCSGTEDAFNPTNKSKIIALHGIHSGALSGAMSKIWTMIFGIKNSTATAKS